ncbi:ArnT family glycosyltransferase [Vulcanococcus limneticus]|uniref:ArnT family glycosyltransferase n=1 Tax=Vulcanococcus limneticus TaxID=2170428 RepID=UPI00398C211D
MPPFRPERLPPLSLLIGGLWLLAVATALVGLGDLPLRDWDEGIVARVALETSQAPWSKKLLPTYWGEPYLNKPPGLHLLIAAAIGLWRGLTDSPVTALPPEWVVRLVPALLSTALVPLLAAIQWRLRPGDRLSALATGAIALTLLPLARHGRLAMLDGCQLVAMALIWWALLGAKAHRPRLLRWGLVAGLGGTALLLLKAPTALPVLLMALGLRLLDRDLGRRDWAWLLAALAVGLLPGLAWHGFHGLARGDGALHMWTSQGFARLSQPMEGHGGGALEPVLEVLEGGWPWLPLWPFGLGLAWRQRSRQAGRWCLGLTLGTALLVLPLRTQLPWYSLLLWPSFALVCGPVFAWLVARGRELRPPGTRLLARLPRLWSLIGAAGLLAAGLAVWGVFGLSAAHGLLALALGLGLLLGGRGLVSRRSQQRLAGGLGTVAGVWLSLLLLMASPLWLWELNESWRTPGVARMLQERGVSGPVRIWQESERPSLNWYAGRRIRGADRSSDLLSGAAPGPALLSRQAPGREELHCRQLEQGESLGLYRCRPESDSRDHARTVAAPDPHS